MAAKLSISFWKSSANDEVCWAWDKSPQDTAEDIANSEMPTEKDPGNSTIARTGVADPAASRPRTSLPKDLQALVDDEDSLMEQIYDGSVEKSTDSNLRYAAYANRLRTILLSAHRYVAYTSDIGESFRPIAHPYMIKSAYAISWCYLIGDVGYEGYRGYLRNQAIRCPEAASAQSESLDQRKSAATVPPLEDWRTVVVQRAIFQGLASMGLPAFTIHSIVRYSGQALKNTKNVRIRTWGPIGLGLAAVPALPYIFDKPVEEATEWAFHKAFEAIGGPDAVRKSAIQQHIEDAENSQAMTKPKSLVKEKEL